MEREVGAVVGFVVLFALMALRIPVGIAMGIVGVGGFAAFVGIDPALSLIGLSTMRTATNYAFGLLPLFILMGNIATESGMSRELFAFSRSWLGHFRGGLDLDVHVAPIGARCIGAGDVVREDHAVSFGHQVAELLDRVREPFGGPV